MTTHNQLRVTSSLTWTPNHDWDAASTRVTGKLSSGKTVGVANLFDTATSDADRRAGMHEWLHGRVLEVDAAADGTALLLVPGQHMDAGVIREALVRLQYGAVAKVA